MIKKYVALLLLMVSFIAPTYAQSIDEMKVTQQDLQERVVQLSTADPADKLFFEDVLRRKNEDIRNEIAVKIQDDAKTPGLVAAVRSEMVLVNQSLT